MAATQAIDVAPRKSAGFDHVGEATGASLSRSRPTYESFTNVSQNGCFESDRVIKSGYVEKRTKTKNWKRVYLVLRPKTLSIYRDENETKLRHQLYLSDLSAVAFLKDPKQKRDHVFGLFSPSRNYHLQAPTRQDAQEWVEIIRRETRIEEEEEEMLLASPLPRSVSPAGLMSMATSGIPIALEGRDSDRVLSSSPETYNAPEPGFAFGTGRRVSSTIDSSGMSGNEMPSHSDLSDNETQRPRVFANRSGSQISISNVLGSSIGTPGEQHPDRVIWQGWLWQLRSKRGVKQWKDMWAVLRPRNLILYKDQQEYTAQWILALSAVVDVVDTDPVKNKDNCLQIITEEKSYRFCTHGEEALVQFIGAFKSLLAKRRGLEARAAASSL
ncbi:PH domain-containing protein [Pochonia chlamydosporia 170]|uniref:PH domain-containing protein n=1 Tax=Pochonia chlamydosporia 170 TaxID=1380566 RepID=A0A219AR66_METCM|nr:PH domain-containing protein [Pochonia chlamydosporia 170]OWT43099.1 PH domain-containing protein [Pochonia chlamydosporia 170]